MRLVVHAALASACLLVLAAAAPAGAPLIASKPPSLRMAGADAVVVGRVVGVEDKDVMVKAHPFPLRVVVVQVGETITGGKDLKTVRVGISTRRPRVSLKAGDEGLLYLMKTEQPGLYLIFQPYEFTAKANPNFAKEVEGLRGDSKLLANAAANLKSDDAAKRFRTGALLIGRYRQYHNGDKLVPIDAAESKLILKALAEAKWDGPVTRGEPIHPRTLFDLLAVSAEDGWRPPVQVKGPQDYANAARAWLREHVNTYRVQRFAAGAP